MLFSCHFKLPTKTYSYDYIVSNLNSHARILNVGTKNELISNEPKLSCCSYDGPNCSISELTYRSVELDAVNPNSEEGVIPKLTETKSKTKRVKDDKDYDRLNIYFKAVIRDFRRFIISDFKNTAKEIMKADYSFITHLDKYIEHIKDRANQFSTYFEMTDTIQNEIRDVVGTLANFKSWNLYKTEQVQKFKHLSDEIIKIDYVDLSQCIEIDKCFKTFTQNRMKTLFKSGTIRYIFSYYIASIFDKPACEDHELLVYCTDGTTTLETYLLNLIQTQKSHRISCHKSMGKNYEKYCSIISKMLKFR